MSKLFDDICQSLQEAILTHKGEIELMPHPAQDKLPAPTFIAVSAEDKKGDDCLSKDK